MGGPVWSLEVLASEAWSLMVERPRKFSSRYESV